MRVDSGWTHSYADVRGVAEGEPQVPYALHLTNSAHRFEHVVFDLDTTRTSDGVGQVWRDAETLLELLHEAGLEHVVAASGPSGGIHVWVPVSEDEGLAAVDVAALARSAGRQLPSLDIGPLCNPVSGAVRPPGSPHRAGGRSELLHPAAPEDALTVFDTDANTAAKFAALAESFGAGTEEGAAAADEAIETRIDREAVRLRGRRSPMPETVRHLLDTPPPKDASAHLFSILTRLALARWSQADVAALAAAEPDAPGLEHLCTLRIGRGRRLRLRADREALLVRQWHRAVERAASWAPSHRRVERDLSGLRAVAAQMLAAESCGAWWSGQAGQADRRVLVAVALVALTAGQEEVDVDIRRLAQMAGVGRSTAHRALERLCADGRLAVAEQARGQLATRYRLIPVDQWKHPVPGWDTREPAPTGALRSEGVLPTREDLLARARARLEITQHDVWAEGFRGQHRGLGRHVEATYAALTEVAHLDSVNVADLRERTGYTAATTRRHLHTLARYGLIDPTTLAPTEPAASAMDAAATTLGTTGTRDAREARYEAERQVWAAWQAELARLRAPIALRPRRRRGERYARTPAGRPDHAAQLARHLAAAA